MLVIAAAVVGSLTVAACNTVRGAAADVNSVANCTQNTINTGRCK
jgi:predicted small secreted protein